MKVSIDILNLFSLDHDLGGFIVDVAIDVICLTIMKINKNIESVNN